MVDELHVSVIEGETDTDPVLVKDGVYDPLHEPDTVPETDNDVIVVVRVLLRLPE